LWPSLIENSAPRRISRSSPSSGTVAVSSKDQGTKVEPLFARRRGGELDHHAFLD
jgi:hypothetical protein